MIAAHTPGNAVAGIALRMGGADVMPTRSKLAVLLQVVTVLLLATSLGWLAWLWNASPSRAIAGFLLILLLHALVLGAEFVALRIAGFPDDTPRPRLTELVKAWAVESVTAARVFCWRQPFRWRAVPDHLEGPGLAGRRGVVFIAGFCCNRGFWTPWLRQTKERGHAFVAVNLEPVFGSIDDYVPIIDQAVERVTAATGLPPLLVCHSMGGLAARAWLRVRQPDTPAAHVVTIGTPHRGTWLARFSHVANGRQMGIGGEWLTRLALAETTPRPVPFTCWYSNCDNVVFPVSTATLPGADNRLLRGAAHVDLAFEPQVMESTFQLLAR